MSEPPEAGEAPPDPALFAHALRLAEALVFASDRPVAPARLQQALPPGVDARAVLTALAAHCADRPVQLLEVGGGFAFLAQIPGTYVLGRCFKSPSLPFAVYYTLGGLGQAAGPFMVMGTGLISPDWRLYWGMAAGLCADYAPPQRAAQPRLLRNHASCASGLAAQPGAPHHPGSRTGRKRPWPSG